MLVVTVRMVPTEGGPIKSIPQLRAHGRTTTIIIEAHQYGNCSLGPAVIQMTQCKTTIQNRKKTNT